MSSGDRGMSHASGLRGLLCLLACAAGTFGAHAESPFVPMETKGQVRDLAADPGTGYLYAAAFDRNAIWVLDPQTGEQIERLPAGAGPSALAVSVDGGYLACVNRLDNTLALYRTSDRQEVARIEVGAAPADVAALADGRFAVANSFSDTLTVVDPVSGATTTPEGTPPVPTSLASAGGFFAAAGQSAPALHIFNAASLSPKTIVKLPGTVTALAGLGEDAFVVALEDALLAVSASAGAVRAEAALAVKALATDRGTVYALIENEVTILDAALEELDRLSLVAPAVRIVAGEGVVAALAPAAESWQLWNRAGLAVHSPATAAAPVAAAPVVSEARPVDEEVPQVVEAEPVESAEAAGATPDQAVRIDAEPAPEPAEEAVPEPAAQSAAPAEPEPVTEAVAEESAVKGARYRKYPIRTSGAYAPTPGRPSAAPLSAPSRRTLADALLQPTELGAPGLGFEAPDWTQPLRDVEAGRSVLELDTGRTVLRDKVRLRLGEMYFHADSFSYSEEQGDYIAKGNVLIEQESSCIVADEVEYSVPAETELPPPSVLEPELSEQERAKRRLTLGHVRARNVHVIEPTRELKADYIDYDFATGQGEILNARGKAGLYFYSADKLKLTGQEALMGEEVWVTTCDHDPPHYKIRMSDLQLREDQTLAGSNARLQLGRLNTPLYLPRWRRGGTQGHPWTLDFDSGRRAEIGYYLNTGQRIEITPDWAIGPRIFPTEKEGIGLGGDIDYDFMDNPASRLYRTRGEAHGLYSTKDRGYLHWQHRYEHSNDLVVRMQVEHWGDRNFYKDFYYDEYRNRTTPRTFANVTYRQPGYIATGTVRASTHGWTRETERVPEGTFHLVERPLGKKLFLTFDTVNGYNNREPKGGAGARSANTARLTYDLDFAPALSLTPFTEMTGVWYSETREGEGAAGQFLPLAGVTGQTRFHRAYSGILGFSGFKHVIVPSVTYSYRPDTTLHIEEIPHYDALDTSFGRSRIETKIENVLYGRDAETGEVWQVGRLTLYQGNDFWNQYRKTDDYEIELDIRPRAWWGMQLVGERHVVTDDFDVDDPFAAQQAFFELYERIVGRPYDDDALFEYNALYGDYDRILAQLYYDDTVLGGRFNSRIGFAYTETNDRVFNREVLYGLGYQLGEKWGVGFEHRYDFETDELRAQTYELRRSLHCWEMAVRVRDRESGTDIDFEFNIKAFPGSKLKF